MAEADTTDEFNFEIEDASNVSIEVEDDTPPEDRNRAPLPKELVEELEADELEDYSDKVKIRLKQMKKVWHDERREKERALREGQEALSVAQRAIEENKRLKSTLSYGEQSLISSYKTTAEWEANEARRAYKEAYEAGDSDKVVQAQEQLTAASYKLEQLRNYRPTLQDTNTEVELPQSQIQAPNLDAKTRAWQERNTWWGIDPEMTASALGLHQKLEKQYGNQFVGTDDYWRSIDTTMQKRFPEYFGEYDRSSSDNKPAARAESRPATVVAPASRSTSSKKVVLRQSQIVLARKLGLTPEQYAREFAKTER
jgi:hypothetical protein